MNDINQFVLIGRLTRDAEIKYTGGGLAISSFSVAVNTSKKTGDGWEDEANFFDCSLFGKRAEALNQYLTKGSQLAITGSLKQDRWEKDGNKRSKVKLMVNDIQLLGSKGEKKVESKTEYDDEVPF